MACRILMGRWVVRCAGGDTTAKGRAESERKRHKQQHAPSHTQPTATVSFASLPSNLHSMSLRQLRSVWCEPRDPHTNEEALCSLSRRPPLCSAAHGFVPKGDSTDEVIAELEHRLYSGSEDAPLMLE